MVIQSRDLNRYIPRPISSRCFSTSNGFQYYMNPHQLDGSMERVTKVCVVAWPEWSQIRRVDVAVFIIKAPRSIITSVKSRVLQAVLINQDSRFEDVRVDMSRRSRYRIRVLVACHIWNCLPASSERRSAHGFTDSLISCCHYKLLMGTGQMVLLTTAKVDIRELVNDEPMALDCYSISDDLKWQIDSD